MKNRFFYLALILTIIAFGINVFAYPFLPDKVPVHWGWDGEVNRYGSRSEILLMGALPLLILLFQKFIPRIDPKKESYNMHSKAYSIVTLIIVLFLALTNVLAVLSALGYNIQFTKVVPVLLGIVFIFMGNYMTQLRHNYFVGFRTPWALASEYVWKKTHRFGGYVFVVVGIIPLFSLIIGTLAMKIFLFALLIGVVAVYLYSYMIFKRN